MATEYIRWPWQNGDMFAYRVVGDAIEFVNDQDEALTPDPTQSCDVRLLISDFEKQLASVKQAQIRLAERFAVELKRRNYRYAEEVSRLLCAV